ncbi:hypothetical protein [Clostridium botulinum]
MNNCVCFLEVLSKREILRKIQRSLRAKVYDKPRFNNKQVIANKTEC